MKPGDTVRYLNAVGGGKVTRIEGKIAYVDEDGFETPVLVKDLVVVAPADYEAPVKGAKIMFDQKAYDAGRRNAPRAIKPEKAPRATTPEATPKPATAMQPPQPRKPGQESLVLAFEPIDIKKLSSTDFNAVLVNDSPWHLAFTFLRRGTDDHRWTLVLADTLAPDEMIDLAVFSHEDLPLIERVAVQAVAFMESSDFELQQPINITKKINLTKFYKLHCFTASRFFDTPVLEVPLRSSETLNDLNDLKALNDQSLKSKAQSPKPKDQSLKPKDQSLKPLSPTKLLPLIEIDLHINQLLDTTAGMTPADILAYQLETVRRTMDEHSRRKGQKIVFIHGKGEGVLRKAVLDFLKKNHPKAEIQDASFREYGFGASLITIH